MVYQSRIVASLVTLLATTVLAAPLDTPGVPASNGVNVTCQNDLVSLVETEPVGQKWFMTIPEGSCKANRMWSHLDIAGCFATNAQYMEINNKKGVALEFFTSVFCTAEKVSNAYRSSSEPPANVACQLNEQTTGTAASDTFDAIVSGLP